MIADDPYTDDFAVSFIGNRYSGDLSYLRVCTKYVFYLDWEKVLCQASMDLRHRSKAEEHILPLPE